MKNLVERLPPGAVDADAILDVFLEWSSDHGLELYPAQEEAVMEVVADRHVVLDTPTGSGKSLVALAQHLRAFAKGRRAFYTSPVKALVNEKFFALCEHFGAANVGLLTGDATINPEAAIVCCTAEVLAQLALADGGAASVHYAALDEFHYYADRDRGMAWQIPLLTLPHTRFLLMSATLGDTAPIRRHLESFTGVPCALVRSTERPVPLDFEYREDPVYEVVEELVVGDRAPVYAVSFAHRDCHDLAQGLTSLALTSREEKQVIAAALKTERFDTPYGKDLRRFLRAGIGVHHAGLLPRYRLLVEGLAQKGLLKVVCGTDTLGVGINVPIRTVLFTKLCKYDGEKTRVLHVRDFKQIAGRAGRKGFDDRGWVVCLGPEHVIENRRLERKAGGDPKKLRKIVRKRPPERGYAHWDAETFQRLGQDEPEPLRSRFDVDHGMVLQLLQRSSSGYRELVGLIGRSHERDGRKRRLRRKAAHLFRTLRGAGILELVGTGRGRQVAVRPDLQQDFSIHHTLSLFLLAAVGRLPPDPESSPALQVLTLVESILEDPYAVLLRQRDKLRRDRLGELKAEGVPYDERLEILDTITWPMPDAELVFTAFDDFARSHPWVRVDDLCPKAIARDMYERFASFNEYVKLYGLERTEGVLLRYLSQVYKTLSQNVPESFQDQAVVDLLAWLRATLARADSSLVRTWETMVHGAPTTPDAEAPQPMDIAQHPQRLEARIRVELHAFVAALSRRDEEAAVEALGVAADDPWDARRLERALAPFRETYGDVLFDHVARGSRMTLVDRTGPRAWRVRQILHDGEGEDLWYVEAAVDLSPPADPDAGPIVTLVDVRC